MGDHRNGGCGEDMSGRVPVFGEDRDPGVVAALMHEPGQYRSKSGAWLINPMPARHGPGPEGTTCASCVHLVSSFGGSRSYYKCELRGISSSVATDHRLKWPTCGLYEAEPVDS